MRKNIKLLGCTIMWLTCSACMIYGVDSEPDNVRKLRYGYVGSGYGNGAFVSSGYTMMDNFAGVSFTMREFWYKAKDLPEDYTGIFNNHNLTMLALMVVLGGTPHPDGDILFGIELGPSWVNYRKEVEIPNPDYNTGWPFPDLNRYIRENHIYNSIGLSGRVKTDFMFGDHVGLELALFGNLNRHQSSFGIECLFIFGKVK